MKKALPYLAKKVINNNSSTLSSKVNKNKVKKIDYTQYTKFKYFSQLEKQDNLDIV